jgi:hypothetical protein
MTAKAQSQNEIPRQDEDFATREVRESLQRYGMILDQVDAMHPDEAIPKLSEMVARTFRLKNEKSIVVYSAAQNKLLSIPGHATYYQDKINAMREQVKAGNLSMDDWSSGKRPYFDALAHMPSEEAVEVLGEFVADKFGFVFSDDPKDLNLPGLKEYDYSHLDYEIDFSVCMPASRALGSIIENPPAGVGDREDERQALWSQWWRDVKSGKRKYRFKGSSVEHPIIAPPGADREVRRPERRPDSRGGADSGKKTSAGENDEQLAGEKEIPKWPLFVGIGIALLVAVSYFLKSRRRMVP